LLKLDLLEEKGDCLCHVESQAINNLLNVLLETRVDSG
jgi:hypothetical protein